MSNLLLVVVFTAANLLLIVTDSNLYLLFSAIAPPFIFGIGRGMADELRSDVFLVIGLVIAFIIVGLYFLCWLLAKRRRVFMVVALVFFVIDSLMLAFLILSAGFEMSYVMDIAFHGWILVYLTSGAMAWAKLRGVSTEDYLAAIGQNPNGVTQQDDNEEGSLASMPLRADDKKGRILVAGSYEGLQISMKRTRGLTELIVDGNVYAEIKGILEPDYALTAHVQGIKIVGMSRQLKMHMYIYVNDVLLAKKLRLY